MNTRESIDTLTGRVARFLSWSVNVIVLASADDFGNSRDVNKA